MQLTWHVTDDKTIYAWYLSETHSIKISALRTQYYPLAFWARLACSRYSTAPDPPAARRASTPAVVFLFLITLWATLLPCNILPVLYQLSSTLMISSKLQIQTRPSNSNSTSGSKSHNQDQVCFLHPSSESKFATQIPKLPIPSIRLDTFHFNFWNHSSRVQMLDRISSSIYRTHQQQCRSSWPRKDYQVPLWYDLSSSARWKTEMTFCMWSVPDVSMVRIVKRWAITSHACCW